MASIVSASSIKIEKRAPPIVLSLRQLTGNRLNQQAACPEAAVRAVAVARQNVSRRAHAGLRPQLGAITASPLQIEDK